MPLDSLYRLFTAPSSRAVTHHSVEFRTYGRPLEDFEAEAARELALLESRSKAHQIEVQRAYAAKSIAWYREKNACVTKFPDDIIIEIFEHCLKHSSNSVMSPHCAPLLLTRVCRRWRDLALSTSSLWASVHVVVPHILDAKDIRAFQRKLLALEAWLDRSFERTLSISVALDDEVRWCSIPRKDCTHIATGPPGFSLALDGHRHGHGPQPEDFPPYFRKLWKTLQPYARRVGYFSLPSCVDGGVLLPGEEAPNLFQLELSRLIRLSYPRSLFKNDAIAQLNAPNLQEILLAYIPANVSLRPDLWSQLRVVEIEFFHSRESLLEFLGRCGNLQDCTISCSNEEPTGELPLVSLPRLQRLAVTSDVVDKLVAHIDMPQLTSLYLQEPDYLSRRASRQPTLESIFRSSDVLTALSHTQLRSLTLQLDPTTAFTSTSQEGVDYHLVGFLETQPYIEHLEFYEPANARFLAEEGRGNVRSLSELDAMMIKVYTALTVSSKTCHCLPGLKTFVLNSKLQLRPAVIDAFSGFVRSRSSQSLLKVVIKIPRRGLESGPDQGKADREHLLSIWQLMKCSGIPCRFVVVDFKAPVDSSDRKDLVPWVGASPVDEWHRGKRRTGERREVNFDRYLEEREETS